MNNYEVLYIVSTKIDEEARKALIAKYTSLAQAFGEVAVNEWGSRELAYPIATKTTGEHRKGFYVLMKFKAPADFPLELERQMRITEDILRFMVERV